jgi:hypothetical protein
MVGHVHACHTLGKMEHLGGCRSLHLGIVHLPSCCRATSRLFAAAQLYLPPDRSRAFVAIELLRLHDRLGFLLDLCFVTENTSLVLLHRYVRALQLR